MKVLILGASGYLGKKLACFLNAANYNITGVYRKLPANINLKHINAVLSDPEEIKEEMQKTHYDWVINCAAAYEHPDIKVHQIIDANIIFALQVLDCCLECGVKKFLTIDTGLPKHINFYSFTKKQFAEFGEFYAKKCGITFVNVVLEMFYGEDEPDGRFLVECCKKMIHGQNLLLTAGTQKRDIIYIEDVCIAIKLILEEPLSGFCSIPVGSGEAVPIRNLLEYMHKTVHSKSVLSFGAMPSRAGEPDSIADLSVLKGMGFQPRYSWKQGIEHLCSEMMLTPNCKSF